MMNIPITGGQPGTPGGVPVPRAGEPEATRPVGRAREPNANPELPPAVSGAPAERVSLDDAVESLNDFVASVQRDIRFRVDDVTGEAIVQVIDRDSDTVVRQIPSEVALQLARRLREHQSVNLLHATG